MKMRTAMILTVIIVVALNLWLMGGGHSGRGQDYYEYQDDTSYADESP